MLLFPDEDALIPHGVVFLALLDVHAPLLNVLLFATKFHVVASLTLLYVFVPPLYAYVPLQDVLLFQLEFFLLNIIVAFVLLIFLYVLIRIVYLKLVI